VKLQKGKQVGWYNGFLPDLVLFLGYLLKLRMA
jgi:hypothetical protein